MKGRGADRDARCNLRDDAEWFSKAEKNRKRPNGVEGRDFFYCDTTNIKASEMESTATRIVQWAQQKHA